MGSWAWSPVAEFSETHCNLYRLPASLTHNHLHRCTPTKEVEEVSLLGWFYGEYGEYGSTEYGSTVCKDVRIEHVKLIHPRWRMVGELLLVGECAGESGPGDQPGVSTTNRYSGIRNVRIIVNSIGMGMVENP